MLCKGRDVRSQKLAARYRLPAVYVFREFVADGGLISYGPNLTDQYRAAARILRGEKPAPTKYEMTVNLKTAKALGLNRAALAACRAVEVIE